MDKTGIIVISICVLLLGWWFVEQNKFAEQQALQQALYQQTNELARAAKPAGRNERRPRSRDPAARAGRGDDPGGVQPESAGADSSC